MHKKSLLFFFIILLLSIQINHAQEIDQNVIGTDGGFAENNQFSITYTIGEVVTAYVKDTTLGVDLTQGFNQSYISILSIDNHVIDVDIDVYPNPAIDYLNVSISSNYDNLQLNMFDISGKLIIQEKVTQEKFKIGFSSLSAGTYLLVFTDNGKNLKTLKVQKSL